MNRKSLHTSLHAHPSVGKHPDRLSHPALSVGRDGHAEEPSEHIAGGFSFTVRGIGISLLASAVAVLPAITAMTAVACRSEDPTALIQPMAEVAVAIASLSGGLTAGLCRRERAVAASLSVGVILTVLLCLLGLRSGVGTPLVWATRLLPLPVCALCGFLTRARPRQNTHRAPHSLSRRP